MFKSGCFAVKDSDSLFHVFHICKVVFNEGMNGYFLSLSKSYSLWFIVFLTASSTGWEFQTQLDRMSKEEEDP